MTLAELQLLTEINDRLKRIEALLPVPCDETDHELVMMIGTAGDLQSAIKARNVRKKAAGLRRRDG